MNQSSSLSGIFLMFSFYILPRVLEMFVQKILQDANKIASESQSRTLFPSHL